MLGPGGAGLVAWPWLDVSGLEVSGLDVLELDGGVPAWPLLDAGEAPELASLPMLLCWGGRDPVFDHRVLAEWRRRHPAA